MSHGCLAGNLLRVITVLVDGENVRRSVWPNIPRPELESLCRAWAEAHGHEIRVVWEGDETADEWLIREASGYQPYWLVTSDRELRAHAGARAERLVGGGGFARELRSIPSDG